MQQHIGNTASFDRTWSEFKAGFGDMCGDYWIGNDQLHNLTRDGRYKLRVDLQSAYNLQLYWAEYSTFIVGNESTNYTLHVGGYRGTAGDAMTPGNIDNLDGMQFTTKDQDHDMWNFANCANQQYIVGGFWMNACTSAAINGGPGGVNGFRWSKLPIFNSSDPARYCLLISRLTLV